MYVPKHFAQPDVAILHALMRAQPLATLITQSGGALDANHLPLYLLDAAVPGDNPHGMLQGHVARANPLWRECQQGAEVLAVFHGPQAYITPSWYPGKKEDGKAVPTWNYAVVHAHGTLRVIDDVSWLKAHVEMLTARQESAFAEPWAVSDAPADYVDKLLKAVVGIEIVMTRLVGKWKTSQNQPPHNRAGVVSGLSRGAGEAAVAMAALVASST